MISARANNIIGNGRLSGFRFANTALNVVVAPPLQNVVIPPIHNVVATTPFIITTKVTKIRQPRKQ